MKAVVLFLLGAVIGGIAVALLDRDDPLLPNVEPEDWIGA